MKTSKEIQRILLGELMPCMDGRLTAAPPKRRILHLCLYGLRNGWSTVRLFGVTRQERQLRAKDSAEQMQAAVFEIFSILGRGIWIQEQPNALACLCQGWRAVLLTAEWEEETQTLCLCAFTGRSPLAERSCNRLMQLVVNRLEGRAEPLEIQKKPARFFKWPFLKQNKKRKEKQDRNASGSDPKK